MILFIKLTHFISKCVEFEFLRDLRFLIVSEESNIASETSPVPLANDRTLPVFKSHLKIQIILVFAMKCKKRNREKLCPLACQRSLWTMGWFSTFFIVPKITTEFFIHPKNHYHKKISKKSLPKICFRIMIFWIFFTAVKIFLENFVVIFPKKSLLR